MFHCLPLCYRFLLSNIHEDNPPNAEQNTSSRVHTLQNSCLHLWIQVSVWRRDSFFFWHRFGEISILFLQPGSGCEWITAAVHASERMLISRRWSDSRNIHAGVRGGMRGEQVETRSHCCSCCSWRSPPHQDAGSDRDRCLRLRTPDCQIKFC